jgi:hypothetical protein
MSNSIHFNICEIVIMLKSTVFISTKALAIVSVSCECMLLKTDNNNYYISSNINNIVYSIAYIIVINIIIHNSFGFCIQLNFIHHIE